MTSYLLKGWNRDKQDICLVVDAEDDLTRGINGHEVARAAAKILDPANTLCFPSCENISPHITVPDQFKYRVLTKDELYEIQKAGDVAANYTNKAPVVAAHDQTTMGKSVSINGGQYGQRQTEVKDPPAGEG